MTFYLNKDVTEVTINGDPLRLISPNQKEIDRAVFKYWKGLIDFTKKEYGVFQCLELVKVIGAYNEEREKENIST